MDRSRKKLIAQLVSLSLDENGQLNENAVADVLDSLKTVNPRYLKSILQDYAHALGRLEYCSQIVLESTTELQPETVSSLVSAFSQKYHRSLKPITRLNKTLLVGLKVRVADDVYEYSASALLEQLA